MLGRAGQGCQWTRNTNFKVLCFPLARFLLWKLRQLIWPAKYSKTVDENTKWAKFLLSLMYAEAVLVVLSERLFQEVPSCVVKWLVKCELLLRRSRTNERLKRHHFTNGHDQNSLELTRTTLYIFVDTFPSQVYVGFSTWPVDPHLIQGSYNL